MSAARSLRATVIRTVTGTVAVAGLLTTAVGCSRSADDRSAPPTSDATTSSTEEPTQPTDDLATTADPTDVTATTTTTTTSTIAIAATTPASIVTVAPVTFATMSEEGTPGLDSDDEFCASWSRFAGSFQVVAVTAAFGSGPPEDLAALEVAASPVVTRSYEDLFANWPAELADEREIVAEQFLGPFERRLEVARDALDEAGADAATIAVIDTAWIDGLAGRDPSTPEFTVDLPAEVWATIDVAAVEFSARLVAFASDPSLDTGVEVPATDAYLTSTCPDQGTLAGQEVESP